MQNSKIVTRGLRNRNPLNIVKSRSQWVGQIPGYDPKFCKFSSMRYGMRAAFTLFVRYVRRYHLTSVAEFIHRWCPDEHAVEYALRVTKDTGLSYIESPLDLCYIAAAMCEIENGHAPSLHIQEISGFLYDEDLNEFFNPYDVEAWIRILDMYFDSLPNTFK